MPTNVLSEIELSWSRRADPDPIINIGESYDANRVYLYSWLRIGPVKLILKSRERARRVFQHLHDALTNALVDLPAREPNRSATDDGPYIPEDDADMAASVRGPKATKERRSSGNRAS